MNSDKHKMERFLHPGRFSMASIYAPITFPVLPLIAFKSSKGEATAPTVAAVGSLRSIDPDRIILKKIILTGYDLFLTLDRKKNGDFTSLHPYILPPLLLGYFVL